MKKISSLILFFVTTNLFAQDGYKININIENTNSNTLYWGYYFGSETNIIKVDSFNTTAPNFKTTIQKPKKIVGGIYTLYFKDKSEQINFIVNNGDNFDLQFDKKHPVESLKFKNSIENTDYANLQNKNLPYVSEMITLKKQIQNANNKTDSNLFAINYNTTAQKIYNNNKEFINKYPNSIGGKYLNLDNSYKKYPKATYWNTFPFGEDRLIITPLLDKMLLHYWKMFPEDASKLNPAINEYLDKTIYNRNLFKFSLWWFANKTDHKNNEQLELVYLNLLDKYYTNGKAYWLDSITVLPYKDAAKDINKVLTGKIAPEITMPDINEKVNTLSEFCKQQKYSLLIMWSPNCVHCQKQIPIMDSILNKIATKYNIKAFAIQNDNDDANWKKFITEHNLNNANWVHLHCTDNVCAFRNAYNAFGNPKMFLLDANRKVLAKFVNTENLINTLNKLK